MKILICPAHYAHLTDRGSEIEWAYQIARSLATKHKGSIVVTGFSNVSNSSYPVVELQGKKKNIDLGLMNSMLFAFSYGFTAIKLLKNNNFDIHHHVLPFSLGRTFNLAFILSHKKIIRIIGPIQKPIPTYLDNLHDPRQKLTTISLLRSMLLNSFVKIFSFPLNALSNMTLRRADMLVVVSEDVKKLLISRGLSNSKIIVIPPGIDTRKFSKNVMRAVKKDGSLNLLSTSALINRKGTEVLIQGFAKALKKSPVQLKLYIVGDGPQRNELQKLVKKLEIKPNVSFYGHQGHDQMPNFYRNADIFISMSRAESWGQMYLEAMASGLAVLTTENDGSRAIIKNNYDGIFVELDDANDLANNILKLVENKDLLLKIQNSAVKKATCFDWKSEVIPRYITLYNKLVFK